MRIDIQDNSEEVLAAFHEAFLRGLEKCDAIRKRRKPMACGAFVYSCKNAFHRSIYPCATEASDASAAIRSKGSVPEKRQMTQLPSLK